MTWKCNSCGTEIDIAEGTTIKFCPGCGSKINTEQEATSSQPSTTNNNCPVCCTAIEQGDEVVVCPDCSMQYHKDCWNDNNGCATYGCKSAGCLNPPPMTVDVTTDAPYSNPQGGGSIHCPHCNTSLEQGSTFCWSCGKEVNGNPEITMFTAFLKYGSCKGRASRKEYWLWTLFFAIICVISSIIDAAIETPVFTAITVLACFVPNLAVTVRRLQDTGKSGWCILLGLIPCVGGLILLIFMLLDSTPGTNEYGPNPKGE